MKRERALQVVLVLVGLFYFGWIYFLFGALWHSSWLNGYQEVGPMFLSLNIVLGAFLLLAVKQPAKHRARFEQCYARRQLWFGRAVGSMDRSTRQGLRPRNRKPESASRETCGDNEAGHCLQAWQDRGGRRLPVVAAGCRRRSHCAGPRRSLSGSNRCWDGRSPCPSAQLRDLHSRIDRRRGNAECEVLRS